MPKIEQFRTVVSNIKRTAQFVGLDENGDAIVDRDAKMPTVTFTGTVKLHGTNASIVRTSDGQIYPQSKTNVISMEKDNAGFAQFVHSNHEVLKDMLDCIAYDLERNAAMYKTPCEFDPESSITVYGEWAGGNIQKGCSLNGLDKMFFIFACKVTPNDEEKQSYWIQSGHQHIRPSRHDDINTHNIYDFDTYTIDIDFNEPDLFTEELERITLAVEEECPVAKMFGVEKGVGEGVVWTGWYNGNIYRFKVKGEKHSVTKVKKLVVVAPEKIESMQKFVEYACTRNRYEQAINEVIGDEEKAMNRLGDVIRWVQKDIIDEETDVLTESGLTHKDVASRIATQVRTWYQSEL